MNSYNQGSLDRTLNQVTLYQDRTRVRKDVETLLHQIPSLQPTHGLLSM